MIPLLVEDLVLAMGGPDFSPESSRSHSWSWSGGQMFHETFGRPIPDQSHQKDIAGGNPYKDGYTPSCHPFYGLGFSLTKTIQRSRATHISRNLHLPRHNSLVQCIASLLFILGPTTLGGISYGQERAGSFPPWDSPRIPICWLHIK